MSARNAAQAPGSAGPQTLKAVVAYFLLVLAAAFLLGTLRELWAGPRLGPVVAHLIEAPVLILAIYFAAYWSIARFAVSPAAGQRVAMGIFALALALAAEALLIVGLRDVTPSEYLAQSDPVALGTLFVVLLAYAAMPLLVLRR